MTDVLQHAEAFIQLRTQVEEILSEKLRVPFGESEIEGHARAAEAIILFFAGRAQSNDR